MWLPRVHAYAGMVSGMRVWQQRLACMYSHWSVLHDVLCAARPQDAKMQRRSSAASLEDKDAASAPAQAVTWTSFFSEAKVGSSPPCMCICAASPACPHPAEVFWPDGWVKYLDVKRRNVAEQEVLLSVETWKFMAMCVITVNLKQIFRHVDATLPKYLIRRADVALTSCIFPQLRPILGL